MDDDFRPFTIYSGFKRKLLASMKEHKMGDNLYNKAMEAFKNAKKNNISIFERAVLTLLASIAYDLHHQSTQKFRIGYMSEREAREFTGPRPSGGV